MASGSSDKMSWRDRIIGKKLSTVNSNTGSTENSGSGMEKPEHGSELGHGEVVPASITHKKVNWIQATLILIAETVSLGILSLPASVADMGLVVGALVIMIFGLCTLATGFMLYYFRMRYPHVQGFGQAGYVLAGRPGQWIAEVLFQLLLIFVMAAHILTFSTMANTVAGDSWKCTVVFKVIGFIICLACTLPRTFKSNSYLSAISCLSILTATLIAMIDIAIIGEGQGTADIAPPSTGVATADWMMSLSNVLVSFTGHLAYFQVMAEMDKPEDFRKSLIATNVSMSSLYMVVAIVIYYYAGADVGSPALSSAAPLFAKLSYGIATPTIVVAGVIAGLLACKRIQAWFWESVKKEPKAADEISFRSWISWVGIVVILWALAFILANVLPYFSPLLALIGAISGTWITLGIPSMTAMYMCHHGFAMTEVEFNNAGEDDTAAKSLELMARERSTWNWWRMFTMPKHATREVQSVWAAAIILFVLNCVMIGFGGYGSIQTMVTLSADNYAPFSCAVGT
ncbi:putative amino acid transporter, transmembrane domain-containing protein [Septoria linicola]|nr:putative amino acid transporter, transmembrane domain-containing protein [Septoria linicola]